MPAKYISMSVMCIGSIVWAASLRDTDNQVHQVVGRTFEEVVKSIEPQCITRQIWTPELTAEQVAPYELMTTLEGWKYVLL